MKVVHARQLLPKSIFLAGPTPRDKSVKSWRPEALRLIDEAGFDGHVYVPEDEDWKEQVHYDDQVEWEWEALMTSTTIIFWVPRNMENMLALTTNVEYGYFIKNLNLAIGWPEDAPKNRYLDRLASRHNLPVYHTLEDTVQAALIMTEMPFKY